MATIVTVTANPLLDHLAETAIVPGRVTRVAAFRRIVGGKGLNMARVLARHGHHTVACGFLGGAAGTTLAALVRSDGVATAFTPTAAATRIGFIAGAPGQGNTSLLENGGPITAAEQDALVADLTARLPGADLVMIGGAPPPGCDRLYVRLLAACATARVPCWIDAYGPAMRAALAGDDGPAPALSKPNREELADGSPWQRVPELHITDGGAAVEIRTPAGCWRVEPPPVAEVNPVGSGDCYIAALAHARLTGWDWERQLRWAAAAGAANAARADVACIGPDDIAPLAAAARITRVETTAN